MIKGIGFFARGDENVRELIVVMVARPVLPQLAPMVKNLPANAGDIRALGSISGLGRSLGGGNDKPLQHSCLGNSMDEGAWQATVHGVTKSRT